MKKRLLILFSFLINCISLFGQSPNWQWAKSLGGDGNDAGLDITADASGNVYTVGCFRDTVDFDPGPGTFNLIANATQGGSFFLSKTDASGNFVWAKKWNKGLYDFSFSVTPDAQGNIFVTGYFDGSLNFDPGPGTNIITASSIQYFVLKLNSSGSFVWVKVFGGVYNTPLCYSGLDASGNIYAAGFFSYTYDFDPGPGVHNLTSVSGRDIFVLKLDASGNFMWVKQISGTLNNWVNAMTLDASDNIYLTGSFSGTTDFDPGPASDSLTAGTTIGNEDIYILKLDASGNYNWAKSFGGTSLDNSYAIAVDQSGNVYTTGYYSISGSGIDFDPGPGTYYLTGNSDCFISKLDDAGNFVFAKSLESPNSFSFGKGIALDSHNNIYYTGYYTDSADFDPGPGLHMLYADTLYGAPVFISELDSMGNFIWAESKGGKFHFGLQQNSGLSVFCDGSDNIYFTGRYEDPDISFGSVTLNNYTPDTLAFTDVFIAKIGSTGTGVNNSIQNSEGIYIYPNPSGGIVNIQGSEKITAVEVYNALGEKIIYKRNAGQLITSVDLSKQPDGIYFYSIHNKYGVIKSGKIIKE